MDYSDSAGVVVEAGVFRQVLGNFPTGVVVVCAVDSHGIPAGMTVGSFTSVSLDPPMVAFLPDKNSTSFPKIRQAASFCVNVLAADQQSVCKGLAALGDDKFAGIKWSAAPSGAPMIDGVVARIDCRIEAVHDAGDHYIVVGKVTELANARPTLPLIFFQGGFGHFAPEAQSASGSPDLITLLRQADLLRADVEDLAAELDVECQITAAVGDELVVLTSSGQAPGTMVTSVGLRARHVPPLGLAFVAWSEEAIARWLRRGGLISNLAEERLRAMVDRVRLRGWSLALEDLAQEELENAILDLTTSTDQAAARRRLMTAANRQIASPNLEPERLGADDVFDVRYISAPIFDSSGQPSLAFGFVGLPRQLTRAGLASYESVLLSATETATRKLHGMRPADENDRDLVIASPGMTALRTNGVT